jgi:P27 family predicted phage terminase small subunit
MNKPTPTKLKLVAGSENRYINFDEPQPEIGIPVCPSPDRRVTEVWTYTCKVLQQMGVLTVADRDALHAYCQAVVWHDAAAAKVAEEGPFITILNTTQPHPALQVMRNQATLIRSFGSEFGLTPSARTRIRMGDQKSKPAGQASASRLLSS